MNIKIPEINYKAIGKEVVETVVFVVVMVVIIRFFIGEIRWIPSASMNPTLVQGDRVFVERFSRFYKTPERGDIMVFYPPNEDLRSDPWTIFTRLTGFACKDIAYIKRVIGVPGDKLEIKRTFSGKYFVYINSKPIDEPYIKDARDFTPCTDGLMCGPLIIPEGKFFMMGDNRGNSQDSRFWGLLDKDRFIGRAVFLFWPVTHLDYFQKIKY